MAIHLIGATKVEISICRKNPNRPLFKVRVVSAKRQGIPGAELKSELPVDPADGNVHVRVMLVAGGLAEYQNKAFKDRHDPDEVARAAGEAFAELMDKLRRQLSPEQLKAVVQIKSGEKVDDSKKPVTNR